MVQMEFLAANHVHVVGLIDKAHRTVIFAIAQLSCFKAYCLWPWLGFLSFGTLHRSRGKIKTVIVVL